MKINNILKKNKGVLAPMLEYTNLSFRHLCRENDCALLYTEMAHINHILNQPLDSISEIQTKDEDYPVSLQLVGDFTDLSSTKKAFEKIENLSFKIIDFNLGCPSPKVAAGKSGAYLLDNIDVVSKTLKEIKANTDKQITAKIRLGFRKNNISAITKTLEHANIDAIAIHGRLGVEGYKCASDYKEVEGVAKDLSIPVIYNGDINKDNYSMFKDIDVFSGLMVGRTALSDPSIFSLMADKRQRTTEENLISFIKFSKKYDLDIKYQVNNLLQLVSGFKGARKARAKLAIAKTQEDIDIFFSKI